MRIAKFRFSFWHVVTVCIIAVLAVFLVYPLIMLFTDGFREIGTGRFTLDNFQNFFSRRFYTMAITNSFRLTTTVTIFSLLIGVPLAYFMSFYKIKGAGALRILYIISMMSPAFIGAYSWILLLGRSGYLAVLMRNLFDIQTPSIYGFGGMVLVFTLRLYPFIFIFASGAFKKIDVSLIEAAEGLGRSGIRKITGVLLPLITPTLVSAALLVFMSAMSDFGTPALIGEGFPVMPTLIFFEFVGEMGGSAYFAAAIATVMVAVTAVLFIAQRWYVNRKSFTMTAMRSIQPKTPKPFFGVLIHTYAYILVAFSIIPQVMVVISSFRNVHRMVFVPGFSLNNYRNVFRAARDAITNTYIYSLIAIAIIVILSMLIAYLAVRRKSTLTNLIDSVAMFPYIIPGSVLGITLLVSIGRAPMWLIGTPAIMIIALAIRRLAFTLRSSTAILYQISPNVEEASISLGDTPLKSFLKITSRIMMPGVLSGAILSWIMLINELSASVMLFTMRTRTMSVAIYNEIIRGNNGNAAALATILTATTVISLFIFFKVSGKKDVSMG